MNKIERRAFAVDRLMVENRDKVTEARIVGHAAVFNQDTDIGGYFVERVAPGAFSRAIREDDVRALFNHNPDYVLGRNKSGTLKLSEDDVGLVVDVMPPNTQFARDLMHSIERGDISQMSFGFYVKREEWDETGPQLKRTLLEVELFDVSPVTFPAYPTTDVALRTLEAFRKAGLSTRSAAPIIRRRLMQRLYTL